MNRLWLIVFLCAVLRATAQDGVAPPDLPVRDVKPGKSCDSYTIETLPVLSFKQKACLYRGELVTPGAIFGATFFGAIGNTWQRQPEWPAGAQGLAMQVGTRFAQGMVKSTATFLVGAALHEDPRALPPPDPNCGHEHHPAAGFGPRLGEALLRVVWTHPERCGANSKDRIAWSRIAGSLASGFVQRAWQPDSHNNLRTALTGSATAMGGYFGASVASEFEYDLFGWLGKKIAAGKPTQVCCKDVVKEATR